MILSVSCTNPEGVQKLPDPEPAEEQHTEISVPEEDQVSVPPYQGSPSVEINDNVPVFNDIGQTTKAFESYSDLDDLGRCGVAYACIGEDLMPTEERGQIGDIHPSGWQTVKYDGIDGNYLYNRCHLIAYSLTAENANEKNLITGTRYMNKEGMNPYEILVTDYIRNTGNHVLYRVTPIFEGDNLLASGVEMEAQSVEDDEISFHVYCYNVQPGININYATGESSRSDDAGDVSESETVPLQDTLVFPEDTTYILNTNTHRFHYINCDSVRKMNEKNRKATNETRDRLIEEGYSPCGNCKP